MRRGVLLRFLCSYLLIASSGMAWSQKPVAPLSVGADPLDDDARLNQKVYVVAEGLPVGALLALMARKSGVGIAVQAELAADKIIVFGPARPLHDVLTDIAALYGAIWLRNAEPAGKPRYRLVENPRTRDLESDLMQGGIKRMMAQLDAQVRALNEGPEQLAKRPKDDPIRERLTDPEGRTATALYSGLNAAQRMALFHHKPLYISCDGMSLAQQNQLQQMLDKQNAEMKAYFEKHRAEIEADTRDALGKVLPQDQIDKAIAASQETMARMGQTDVKKGVLHFTLSHTNNSIEAAIEVKSGVNPQQLTLASFDTEQQWLLPPHGNPYTGAKIGLASTLPDPAAVTEALGKDWIESLHALADKTNRPVISDFYHASGLTEAEATADDEETSDAPKPKPAPAANTAPAAVLDDFCHARGYLWWQRGNSLLLRKRDWFDLRPAEVPDDWIVRLAQALKAQKNVPTYTDLLRVLDLTDAQLLTLCGMGQDNYSYGDDESHGLRELLLMLREKASLHGNTAPITNPFSLQKIQAMAADGKTPDPANFGALMAEATKNAGLGYADLSLAQRSLLQTFLATQANHLKPANITNFRVIISQNDQEMFQAMPPDTPNQSENYIGISLVWMMMPINMGIASNPFAVGEMLSEGNQGSYTLYLPIRLPDDRRAKTRVELVP